MINDQTSGGGPRGNPWRIAGWGFAVFLLVLPFVAMQVTREVNWTASDFVFAALVFGSVGLAIEFLVRRSDNAYYRWGAVMAVLAAFLTVWVNAAVGMIGDEGNPHNLLFGGVLLVALAGAIVVRFDARGMAWAMAATAIAQGVAGAAGFPTDERGAVFSMCFAIPWALAAALFGASARAGIARGSVG